MAHTLTHASTRAHRVGCDRWKRAHKMESVLAAAVGELNFFNLENEWSRSRMRPASRIIWRKQKKQRRTYFIHFNFSTRKCGRVDWHDKIGHDRPSAHRIAIKTAGLRRQTTSIRNGNMCNSTEEWRRRCQRHVVRRPIQFPEPIYRVQSIKLIFIGLILFTGISSAACSGPIAGEYAGTK